MPQSPNSSRRRFRFQVIRTGAPSSAAPFNPGVQPPRQIFPKVVRRPYQPARITILHTPQLHGSFQGARPQIFVARAPQRVKQPRPIILHTRPLPNIPPPIRSWPARPNIVHSYARQGRWRPVLVRTGPVRLPSPAMPKAVQVLRWIPGPPPKRPILFSTRPTSPSRTRLQTVAVGRLPIIPWRIRPVVMVRSHAQAQARPVPRVIVPLAIAVKRRPPALPWKNYQISTHTASVRQNKPHPPRIIPRPVRFTPSGPKLFRTPGNLASPRPPRLIVPMVVRVPRQPVRPRPAIILKVPALGHTLTLPLRPLVVRRPPGLRLWPTPVRPAARYQLLSPALHGPMPRPMIFRLPRRSLAKYPPFMISTVFPGSGGDLPPDLVAAILSWIRQKPALVAAFGDSSTTPKFGTDIGQPGTAPPYVSFFEPDESESYESVDFTGLPSSLTDGTLGCEVVATGKLQVRQLAEQIAQAVNDAPLTFQDGVLVYLRRSDRKFPSFREHGPGSNVALFKRYLEFDFKIERWSPAF